MICPHCQYEFENPAANCPDCGIRIVHKISGMVKTSTVMIATGGKSSFYRSVQEVPETLRRQLIETTNSENSGMIVIADNAGKEQWTEIVAHREAQQSASLPETLVPQIDDAPVPVRNFIGLSWSAWAGVLLFLAAGAMIASMFEFFHW
jgi:DNA-directed RNA polymerase subunit RPC12/RpoP